MADAGVMAVHNAVKFHVGFMQQQPGQKAAGETGDAGQEYAHVMLRSAVRDWMLLLSIVDAPAGAKQLFERVEGRAGGD